MKWSGKQNRHILCHYIQCTCRRIQHCAYGLPLVLIFEKTYMRVWCFIWIVGLFSTQRYFQALMCVPLNVTLLGNRIFACVIKVSKWVCSLVTLLCLTLCNPCQFPQARLQEWAAIPFSRGSSWPRDWTRVSCNAGRFFTVWATREFVLS